MFQSALTLWFAIYTGNIPAVPVERRGRYYEITTKGGASCPIGTIRLTYFCRKTPRTIIA